MKSLKQSFQFLHHFRLLSTVTQPLNPVQEAALNEKCILVDQNDKECGYASKRDCHKLVNGEIPLHRAFSVFLFNTKDELLLQQRSSTKITFPNHFTNSCCSHPLYDIIQERDTLNGAKAAACRRLSFELGIPREQCKPEDLQYITRIRYMSEGDGTWGEHEIDYIFVLHKDVTLDPNPEEVKTVLYVPKTKIYNFLNNLKYPITPWFNLIVQNELSQWWENLQSLEKVEDHQNIIHYN
ncbi:isopentenyl-diphosphate Delta-isomerase 1 [Daktulosphaira vitifoliae]|uniref:isopentenyl-diphosphate Delta-isomerase 1 n=1 Tax=Daktulosphaira vitifoliae TaxID=58002 RepID=UPI0021AAEBD1|nr:isopentenyl-diphosphate Delta-isomerase 1 [Daktulosphaira vitifoliae]XP_050546908.1 isopentenyl-diphosphate Delta-isomerase 1 [Daktulosphaira vitifoliae]